MTWHWFDDLVRKIIIKMLSVYDIVNFVQGVRSSVYIYMTITWHLHTPELGVDSDNLSLAQPIAIMIPALSRWTTAVTFFPRGRGRIKDAQIQAKYAKFPWMKSRGFWCIEWMGLDGSLVCLVREIWQFKVFAGKEVTALSATRVEGG